MLAPLTDKTALGVFESKWYAVELLVCLAVVRHWFYALRMIIQPIISEIRGNYVASCSNRAAQFVCSNITTCINLMSSYKKTDQTSMSNL